LSISKDEITLTKFDIITFLEDVSKDLTTLFSKEYVIKYIHNDSQDVFQNFGKQLQEKISNRIFYAIDWIRVHLDSMNTHVEEFWKKLEEIGWTGIEKDFKIKVWKRFSGGLDKGWKWLQSKFDIIDTFLGSLSSAGIPGLDAIAELKDVYEACKIE
jgi:hypothetical protein